MPEASPNRELLYDAMIDSVLEQGYEATSVAGVCRRAGIDQAAFEVEFDGKEDCFMAVFDEYVGIFDSMVFGAYEAEDVWRDGLRAAAWAAAEYIRLHPRQTRFGATAMFEAGPVAQVHREAHLQRIVDPIDDGRQELADPDSIGRGVAEATMGSIYSTLIRQLQEADGPLDPQDYVPELMYIALRPYLGHEIASEELSAPPP